jgi:flagellar biosynthesis GTPase FlhF
MKRKEKKKKEKKRKEKKGKEKKRKEKKREEKRRKEHKKTQNMLISNKFSDHYSNTELTLSDPTSNLVRQYDFPVPFRCRKMSDTVFVAFVRPLSEPVRCFSSFSTDFSQQIARVVLFLFLHVFLF